MFFKNFSKCTGKHLCHSLFFNNLVGLGPATLFLQNTSGRILLKVISYNFETKTVSANLFQWQRLLCLENRLQTAILGRMPLLFLICIISNILEKVVQRSFEKLRIYKLAFFWVFSLSRIMFQFNHCFSVLCSFYLYYLLHSNTNFDFFVHFH